MGTDSRVIATKSNVSQTKKPSSRIRLSKLLETQYGEFNT